MNCYCLPHPGGGTEAQGVGPREEVVLLGVKLSPCSSRTHILFAVSSFVPTSQDSGTNYKCSTREWF